MLHYVEYYEGINGFRVLSDLCHVIAMLTLLFKILRTKSCTGISGRSQILMVIVFLARYMYTYPFNISAYDTITELITLACTTTTAYLIYNKYPETYDRSYDTFRLHVLLIPCLVLAYFVNYHPGDWPETIWTFSVYLEAVAIVPQMKLTRKMGFTAHMAPYIVALGFYAALNVCSWVFRHLYQHRFLDVISIGGGVVQTIVLTAFLCVGWKKVNAPDVGEIVSEVSVVDGEKPRSPLDSNFKDSNMQLLIDNIIEKPKLTSIDVTKNELANAIYSSK